MGKKTGRRIMIFSSIVMIGISGVFAFRIYKKVTPNKNMADLKKYYNATEDGKAAIVYMDKVEKENKVLIEDNDYYIGINAVRNATKAVFFDENDKKVIVTTPTKLITIEDENSEYLENGESKTFDNVIVKNKGDLRYISLNFIEQNCSLEYKLEENPNRIVLRYNFGKNEERVNIVKDSEVREKANDKSNILKKVKKGDNVRFIKRKKDTYYPEDFQEVMTDDGLRGYIRKKYIDEKKEVKIERTKESSAEDYTNMREDYGKVALSWIDTFDKKDNNYKYKEYIENVKGLNVISLSWMSLSGGSLTDTSDSSIVSDAHSKGIKVWSMFRDMEDNTGLKQKLMNTESRQELAKNVVSNVKDAGADGVNIDFEKIAEETSACYIQFLRELYIECRKENLALSVDSYVPFGNEQYDIGGQSEIVDYVVLMTYDQNKGKTPLLVESSSDKNWVNTAITRASERGVQKDGLIIALPFYCNLNDYTSQADVHQADCTMNELEEKLGQENLDTAQWDEEKGQNHIKYEADGKTYETWIEDAKSVETKLDMLKQNEIAGCAFWRIGQETSDVWDVVAEYSGY